MVVAAEAGVRTTAASMRRISKGGRWGHAREVTRGNNVVELGLVFSVSSESKLKYASRLIDQFESFGS